MITNCFDRSGRRFFKARLRFGANARIFRRVPLITIRPQIEIEAMTGEEICLNAMAMPAY
jgi:hypothetical protein